MILPFKIFDSYDVKIYGCNVGMQWEAKTFHDLLSSMPVFLQKKILAYAGWKDRQSRLAGKSLLSWLLKEIGEDELIDLTKLKFSSHNKPYFEGGIEFSIAHSNDIVICGISKKILGVDVEEVRMVDVKDYLEYFHPFDIDIIKNSIDPLQSFYRLWTRREALAKALGSGVEFTAMVVLDQENCFIEGRLFDILAIKIADCYVGSVIIENYNGEDCFKRISDYAG